jgi:hypothetical protein
MLKIKDLRARKRGKAERRGRGGCAEDAEENKSPDASLAWGFLIYLLIPL